MERLMKVGSTLLLLLGFLVACGGAATPAPQAAATVPTDGRPVIQL
ncbi:MAG: hypothetical protein H0T73_14490, partial [Ardenticatenales bacterium]|nr:hypothetical protein [Ardenticatenales bacterium]